MSSTPLTILHGGHRKAMRIGANESMSTVVQTACREFGLDAGSSNLVLKHKRNVVDLSQPFRFTGIPQNATLELVEEVPARRRVAGAGAGSGSAGGQVRVAMRLPGGGRVQAPFSADTTLLGLLQWWAGRGELAPGVLEQGPSLQFMRTAYGAGDLGSTTLRSIGVLTGSAMFTLSLSSPGATTTAATATAPAAASSSASPLPPPPAASPTPAATTTGTVSDSVSAAKSPDVAAAAAPRAAAAAAADGGSPAVPKTAAATVTAVPTVAGAGNREHEAAAAAAAEVQVQDVQVDGVAGGRQEGGGPAGAAVAAAVEEMEVDSAPPLPAMGIEVCRTALEVMAAGHFDSDSEACVLTLAKVVDNVVHRPDDARTRQIRCGNAAFQQKVGRITGGILFLEGVGFVSQGQPPQQQILGGGGGSSGDRFLVLAPDREDAGLLKQARALLSQQARALGVPPERMPQPPRARPAPPPPASGQAAFDPYKPFMTSTAPTPKGPQEQSTTERRLQELLAKRADVVSGGVPDRNIQVILPSQAAATAAAAPPSVDSGGGGGGGGGGRFGGGEGERGDGGLLAKKVARQIAERKKRDEVPFQTKAMREIERLQKATVYRTTVIKVQFPDRVVLQATFASTEGVNDLMDVVRGSLEEKSRERQFELYVSPPRVVLKAAQSLSDSGLVPAALVYVSWKEVPPAGEPEGGYLKPELTSGPAGGAGAGAAAAAARPVGVALDGGAKGGAEESKSAGGARGGGGNRLGGGGSGGGSGGAKRTGKPSWLKIN